MPFYINMPLTVRAYNALDGAAAGKRRRVPLMLCPPWRDGVSYTLDTVFLS